MDVKCEVTVEARFDPPLEFRHEGIDYRVAVVEGEEFVSCIFGCQASSPKKAAVGEAKGIVYQHVESYHEMLEKALAELQSHYDDVSCWMVDNEASRRKDEGE